TRSGEGRIAATSGKSTRTPRQRPPTIRRRCAPACRPSVGGCCDFFSGRRSMRARMIARRSLLLESPAACAPSGDLPQMFGFKSKPPAPAAAEPAAERPSLFKRLRAKLNRGDSWLTYDLANLLPGGKIDESVLE